MRYRLRDMETARKFSSSLTVEAFDHAVPHAALTMALHAEGVHEQRERKLTLSAVMLLLITMNLYPHLSLGAVWRKLVQGLRFIWPDPQISLVTEPAITYRRYQIGARPMVSLFHHICKPLATPQTHGAFLFGLRVMAIDGTVEDVPDTPANLATFGRHPGPRGDSAHPQLQCVYLTECGTHVIVDAGVWPCRVSERVGGRRMLRSVEPGMLVMWDRGFHEYNMVMGVLQRQAHVLARLPAHACPRRVRTLPDGSYLAFLAPSDYQRRKQGEGVLVRIVEYTLTDAALPGHGKRHRIITTLLDHEVASAVEVVCAYHERWEIEVVIDEVDTHQRLAARTLRSLKPVGVIQELYAVLIAHYAVRALMHEAAVEADVDPDRLSFVHAVRVLQDAIPEFQMVAPEQVPDLYRRLLGDLATERLPERRLRSNARVVKRKMSSFRLKRPNHFCPPKPVGTFQSAVLILRAPPIDDDECCILELPMRSVKRHVSEPCLI